MNSYKFKIYPEGKGREIYRVISVSGDVTLHDFASLILQGFDFDFDHLYEFCMNNRLYDDNNYTCEYVDYGTRNTERKKLDALKLQPKQKFIFHFDFGADWTFVVNVQDIQKIKEHEEAFLLKEKGKLEQYPSYDDEYVDDDEMEYEDDEE